MALLKDINGRIGIWGYGVVGKAVAHFLVQHKKQIAIYDTDSNQLSDNFFVKNNIPCLSGAALTDFFKSCAVIVPSPGIDLRPYATYGNTYLYELDIFAHYWHKPIIGVTGSVGKTSVTTILGHLMRQNNIPVAVGGNIGVGSLDLIAQQDTAEYALLELSSFQLEHTEKFSPHIALITNLHPNHLDRHGSLDNYWQAKAQIALRQRPGDLLLIDWALRDRVRALALKSTIWYVGIDPLSNTNMLLPHEGYWYAAEEMIHFVRKLDYQTYKQPKSLFSTTLAANALMIYATLVYLTHNRPLQLSWNCDNLSLPHRRELIGTYRGITFINDSKATSIVAMQAAVNAYAQKPIYLLIGGLGKGVDRTDAIAALPPSVVALVCFGAEAHVLSAIGERFHKKTSVHVTLDDALHFLSQHAQAGSVVLMSPAGSSYDLYKNYEERGNHFKQLVYTLYAQDN